MTLRPPAFVPTTATPPHPPGGRVWARADLMAHLRDRDVPSTVVEELDEDPFPLTRRP